MKKEKCEICDKTIDGDPVHVCQKQLEEIKYEIPTNHLPNEILTDDISEKVKGKVSVVVGGSPCYCNKKINIAINRIKK